MMESIAPADVLRQVAVALPANCREQVIIIGSLAAAYHFFGTREGAELRTKDVDCMFVPHAKAVTAAREVAEQLMEGEWSLRDADPQWAKAGTAEQADEELPLVRLHPPGSREWFIELMGVPAAENDGRPVKKYERIKTRHGDFALCSFGFLGLAEWQPIETEFGLRIARPEMMALANLLHHPIISDSTISGNSFGPNRIKRSNKDLGRVLALAYLAEDEAWDHWASRWEAALTERYSARAGELANSVGSGLREMLESPEDLEQALITCNLGLLSSLNVTREILIGTGSRLVAEVIEPLEAKFNDV